MPLIYTYKQKDAIDDKILSNFEVVNMGINLNQQDKSQYTKLMSELNFYFAMFNHDFLVVKKQVRFNKNAQNCMKLIQERRKFLLDNFTKVQKVF